MIDIFGELSEDKRFIWRSGYSGVEYLWAFQHDTEYEMLTYIKRSIGLIHEEEFYV